MKEDLSIAFDIPRQIERRMQIMADLRDQNTAMLLQIERNREIMALIVDATVDENNDYT